MCIRDCEGKRKKCSRDQYSFRNFPYLFDPQEWAPREQEIGVLALTQIQRDPVGDFCR